MATTSSQAKATGGTLLGDAVHRAPRFSREGLLERAFTMVFSGLVYPQIWEDPEVDLTALALDPGARMITISSGGCNALSYLTADPGRVIAVDLNHHHIHLARLKRAGLRDMPNYQAFYRFFGVAKDSSNPDLYTQFLRDGLEPDTRAYWDSRDTLFRRRIKLFTRNLYAQGLLGRFIWVSHMGARLLGTRMEPLLDMRNVDEQKAYFDKELAPLFDTRLVRWITSNKASLFGLGIPPAQYESLARAGGGDMAVVLRRRLEKLACDFPVTENYFAQQAFGRRYAPGDGGPLPPYLQSRNFEALSARADNAEFVNQSMTERLKDEGDASMDAFVFLDAQDWMTDEQLDALWTEVTRSAKPGARVIFRTADVESLLPGRLDNALLSKWTYHDDRSTELTAKDRSAIYGGFHLYTRNS
ncbi:DUF3419 family protein [Rhodobacteraceae bacterium NNCM2]|nr:DUF3419 family protein [Coraliihabitans acroporae]